MKKAGQQHRYFGPVEVRYTEAGENEIHEFATVHSP